MTQRRRYLASTVLSRAPLAFASLADTRYGITPLQLDRSYLRNMIAAAEIAANQGDPITTKDALGAHSADMLLMLDYWNKTDDIVAGYDAIKAQSTKYLPKFPNETAARYEARLNSGEFTNVYRDVVESLAGKPFAEEISLVKDDKVTTPDGIETFLEDVDGAGNNITSFAAATFFNGINSAIDWIWVDYPKVAPRADNAPRSIADVKAEGIRPFWSHVLGRNVLEAQCGVINGRETLIYVRIWEPGKPNHVRVIERSADGTVTYGLFEERIEGIEKHYVLIDTGPITIGVIPLVPFYTGRRDGRTYRFFPVMRDAADLQIVLYQQECGLAFTKLMSAYPMLAANGVKLQKGPDGKPLPIDVGPSVVLVSEPDGNNNHGSWEYVQPSAEILKFLADDIKSTMDQLRELGRQPLTAQSGNLTVITTAYAAGKAKTAVGAWGMRLKDALENALVMTCMWLGIKDYEPSITIYDEYDDYNTDQAADLSALTTMREKGDISRMTLHKEMKRRDVLSPDFNTDKDAEALLKETSVDDTTAPGDVKPPTPLKVVP